MVRMMASGVKRTDENMSISRVSAGADDLRTVVDLRPRLDRSRYQFWRPRLTSHLSQHGCVLDDLVVPVDRCKKYQCQNSRKDVADQHTGPDAARSHVHGKPTEQ